MLMILNQFLKLVSCIFLVNLKSRLQLTYLILILPAFFLFLQFDLSFELSEVFLNLLELKLAFTELDPQFLAIIFFGVVVNGF